MLGQGSRAYRRNPYHLTVPAALGGLTSTSLHAASSRTTRRTKKNSVINAGPRAILITLAQNEAHLATASIEKGGAHSFVMPALRRPAK